jgi:hypothetical protein
VIARELLAEKAHRHSAAHWVGGRAAMRTAERY